MSGAGSAQDDDFDAVLELPGAVSAQDGGFDRSTGNEPLVECWGSSG